ncbi:PhzF family phenazine biosynthesis protein [Actinoplanes sp. NPDC051851]|uniref:PhzF family phenazine biosynthesis protein n=1 Tax=Actinoplanes sp. NPDC051851 TaxID=3154753 RepID=UPI00343419C6
MRVTIVDACLRDGRGGSPTAVVEERETAGIDHRRVPVLAGTSHAVLLRRTVDGPTELRFFTREGELPACGHGTVAALTYLDRDGDPGTGGRGRGHRESGAGGRVGGYRELSVGGRVFGGRVDGGVATFEQGRVRLRDPLPAECDQVLEAYGTTGARAHIASLGRERMLVEAADPAALTPDLRLLRAACDRFGLLGCYAYSPPDPHGRRSARMFAPSIGVPEDIANVNSTSCLAALLNTRVVVDMGDSLGRPATVVASIGPGGVVEAGGAARVVRDFRT